MPRFLLFILFFSSLQGFSYQLRGTITNSYNEPIPYASVVVENSTYGVITNLKGQYYLELTPGTHVILFKHPEYETLKATVTITNKVLVHDVVMKTSLTSLNAVIITSDREDPAYGIIRSAIKNKKRYQNQYESFVCSTYIKSAVEKGNPEIDWSTGKEDLSKKHHNFVESFSKTYFKQPNTYKQVVYAYNDHTVHKESITFSIEVGPEQQGPPRQNPYNPDLFRQSSSEQGFNFYDNLIDIPALGTTPFISPISVTAMLSYDYKLEETFTQDSVAIYKIRVIPKRDLSATFKGYIFIEDSTWAIRAVDFQILPYALMFFKTFYITHEYGKQNDSIYVLNREEYFYTNKSGEQRIFGNTVLLHRDYKLNIDFPPRFFKNEIKEIQDGAYDKDTAFWNSNRPITLRKEESEFVHYQDSIITYQATDAYKNKSDSVYNQVKLIDFLILGVGFRNWTKKQSIYFDPILLQVRPFGVGGYRHVLPVRVEKEWNKGYKIKARVAPDYGFNNKDLKGELDLRFTYLPKRFGEIHLQFGDTYELLNSYESISATFSRSNYINRKGYTVGHSFEVVNGLYLDVDFEYAKNYSITNLDLSNWSEKLFGSLNAPKDFSPFSEAYVDVNLTYSIKQKYYNEPHKKVIIGSDYPKLGLWYKRGIKGLMGSIVDFDFLELSAEHNLKIGTAGETRWRIIAGSFFRKENVQLTNYKFFRRSDRYFFSNPTLSMQLLTPPTDTLNGFYPGVIATINNYIQANYIHHFNGALMNKIPLINRLKLEAVVGAGYLYVQNNNFSHLETFVGIERPVKIKDNLFKFGVYYVGADSNFSSFDTSFKFGINFFDPFNNKWQY